MDLLETTYSDAIDLLDKNAMEYLPLLKYASAIREKAQYFKILHQNEYLIMMKFDKPLTHHDLQLYPYANSISIISGTYHKGIKQCIEMLAMGTHIIKSELDITNINNNVAIKIREFHSFTNKSHILISHNADVVFFESINSNFEPLFKNVGYSLDDINNTIRSSGKVIALIKVNIPISGCVVFPNYKNIWEIGAVATIPEYRHNGFAKCLVSTANNYLLDNQYIPRYHVESTNIASVSLAKKLGFHKYFDFRHYEISITAN